MTTQPCPICGSLFTGSAIFAHVGSARCLVTKRESRPVGYYFDQALGPRVHLLAAQLRRLLKMTGTE